MAARLRNEVLEEIGHGPLHVRRLFDLHVEQTFHAVKHDIVSFVPRFQRLGRSGHRLLLPIQQFSRRRASNGVSSLKFFDSRVQFHMPPGQGALKILNLGVRFLQLKGELLTVSLNPS